MFGNGPVEIRATSIVPNIENSTVSVAPDYSFSPPFLTQVLYFYASIILH